MAVSREHVRRHTSYSSPFHLLKAPVLVPKLFLPALLFLSVASAQGKGLECWLPSLKDGSEITRLAVTVVGTDVSVVETRSEKLYQSAATESKIVLFHQFTDPRVTDSSQPYNVEPPHSLILTKSNYKGKLEFAADIIIVNWGKGTLKSVSSYNDSFAANWRCVRRD